MYCPHNCTCRGEQPPASILDRTIDDPAVARALDLITARDAERAASKLRHPSQGVRS